MILHALKCWAPFQTPVCVKLDVTPEVRCDLSKKPPSSEKLYQEFTLPTEPGTSVQ